MRYSDDLINEIFAQNDIVDYVSQYVKLNKKGRDYTGLCPFHKEKSPSFHVNQEKQLFHCFGCGVGGNLVQFVMKSEGLDFVEAIKLMADRAGIILPEDDMVVDDKVYQKKKRIYAMNKTAARFYYETLTTTELGKAGLEYFTERKITSKTITNYGLGYAPEGFEYLKKHMNNLGFSDNELLEAGLCVAKNDKVYDKFRGRVIFPIIDLRGNVIGFGGRILKPEERDGYKPPKYLNSAETLVFNKGKNLFSLNLAKKNNSKQCILCEGYMDVISVYQAGIPNIVATLGTALTSDQAKLLMKYTSEILLCYDSDEAGQNATKRAIEIINSVGGRCRIIKLKNAKDPDEYIKSNGVDLFKKAIANALPSTEYLLRLIKSQYDLENPNGKILFVNDAADILSKIQSAVEVDAYIKQISDETGIRKEAVYAELKKKQKSAKIGNTPTRAVQSSGNKNIENLTGPAIDAQKKLLSLVIESKKNYLKIRDKFTPGDYSHDLLRRLAQEIYSIYETNDYIDAALVVNKFLGNEADVVSQIFCNIETYESHEDAISQLLNNIKLDKLNASIEDAMKENNIAKLKELLAKRLELEGNK